MAAPYSSDLHSGSSFSLQHPLRPLRLEVPLSSDKSSPARPRSSAGLDRQFVKQEGPIRLTFDAEPNSAGRPEYATGDLITGSLELSKITGLLSIKLKATGTIVIQEIGGAGIVTKIVMFSNIFHQWNHEVDAVAPHVVPFSYTIPTKYTDENTGLTHMVPPTYKARLDGVPGFKVKVVYEVSGVFMHARQKAWLWKKDTRISVPFTYKPRYTPNHRPTFPTSGLSLKASADRDDIKSEKVFKNPLQSRNTDTPPVETRTYLPFGQVCVLDEPISFVIKVFGEDDVLNDFAASTPLSPEPNDNFSSFHPLSSATSRSSMSPIKLASIRPTTPQSNFHIKVELQRTTLIEAAVGINHTLETNSDMSGHVTLAEGSLQAMTRGVGWVAWSGQIIIPPDTRCGGFTASSISVFDDIILSIVPMRHAKSLFMPLTAKIPLRLTARSLAPLAQYWKLTSPPSAKSTTSSESSYSSADSVSAGSCPVDSTPAL